MIKLKQILSESIPSPSSLTPLAAACLSAVLNQFGRNTFKNIWGLNKRNISGTSVASEHTTGNALDFMVYDNKKLGDRVNNYLLDNAERLGIQNIIWYKKIWSRPSFTERNYGGVNDHKDHVHVDFIKGDNETNLNITTNKYLIDLINAYYKISTTDPESYFKEFKSWNPLSKGIGDNEEGAADKLITRFLKIYEPKLKQLEQTSSTSYEDKKNIQLIREIVDTLNTAILAGKSTKFTVVFFKLNPSTNKYENKSLNFNWNYL
jgi:hypothetical protein